MGFHRTSTYDYNYYADSFVEHAEDLGSCTLSRMGTAVGQLRLWPGHLFPEVQKDEPPAFSRRADMEIMDWPPAPFAHQ